MQGRLYFYALNYIYKTLVTISTNIRQDKRI